MSRGGKIFLAGMAVVIITIASSCTKKDPAAPQSPEQEDKQKKDQSASVQQNAPTVQTSQHKEEKESNPAASKSGSQAADTVTNVPNGFTPADAHEEQPPQEAKVRQTGSDPPLGPVQQDSAYPNKDMSNVQGPATHKVFDPNPEKEQPQPPPPAEAAGPTAQSNR